MKRDISKLLNYLKEEGVIIDGDLKKIVDFFNGKVLANFSPSGFGGTTTPWEETLSKKTGIRRSKVNRLVSGLGQLNLLEEERGMGSVAGREYDYGFTKYAYSIMDGETKPEATGRLKGTPRRSELLIALGFYLYCKGDAPPYRRSDDVDDLPDECLTLVVDNPGLIDDELWKQIGNKLEGYTKTLIRRDDGTLELAPKQ